MSILTGLDEEMILRLSGFEVHPSSKIGRKATVSSQIGR